MFPARKRGNFTLLSQCQCSGSEYIEFWIQILNFGPIWIRIQGYVINYERKIKTIFEKNVRKNTFFLSLWMVNTGIHNYICLQSHTFCQKCILYLPVWIRIPIRNTDPDPQRPWIRIQSGSGSTAGTTKKKRLHFNYLEEWDPKHIWGAGVHQLPHLRPKQEGSHHALCTNRA